MVAFSDDDCWYPESLLAGVAEWLGAHPEWAGLSGRSVDEHGRPSGGRSGSQAGAVTRFNLWARTASYTLFLCRPVVEAVGPFDETLGVGAGTPWGGAEDLDYVLRSLASGFSLYYDPSLVVHHPQKRERVTRPNPVEGYSHALGMGRVLRKAGLPWSFAAYQFARSFGAAVLSLVLGRPAVARFYWAVGRGRLRAWLVSADSSSR